jgi:hypothetical protein
LFSVTDGGLTPFHNLSIPQLPKLNNEAIIISFYIPLYQSHIAISGLTRTWLCVNDVVREKLHGQDVA